MILIDTIIPSYRLQSKYLIPIIQMQQAENTKVRYLIIADNPDLEIPHDILKFIDDKNVILYRNKENLGAALSRNLGIDNSHADWILFLDDDVIPDKNLLLIYKNAIDSFPDESGFFGKTAFPEPVNSFTKGLIVSDMLHFFEMVKYDIYTKSATTSNVIVKKKAIGDIRFSDVFPKKGGGEDFAFFLEIHEKTQKYLKSAPAAIVYHDWWYDGKRNYSQFFRWCYAEYELFRKFPSVTYYDFPNFSEMFLIGLITGSVFSIITLSWIPLICVATGIIIGELLGWYVFLLWAKGFINSLYFIEVAIVRGVADFGRLSGLLMNNKLEYLFKRASYSVEKLNIHFFVLSGFKFICYLVSIGLFLLIFFA